MKNIFRFLMAAVIFFGAVSCAKEDISTSLAGGEVEVTFTANLPELGTRAYGNAEHIDILHYNVYQHNQEEKLAISGVCRENTNGKFFVHIPMIKGMQYDIVFWAEKENNSFYTLNGKELTINYNGAIANDENRDAFLATKTAFDPTSVTSPCIVELTRPFAQLNVATSDYNTIKNNGIYLTKVDGVNENIDNITSNLNITTEVDTKFNLFTNEVADGSVKQTVTFAPSKMPSASTPEETLINYANYTYLSMNYIFVLSEKESVDVEYNFTGNRATDNFKFPFTKVVIPSVPLKRNYRTNILGKLLTQTADFEVVLEKDFDDPDQDYVMTAADLKEQIENAPAGEQTEIVLGGDIDLNDLLAGLLETRATTSAGLIIPEGKEIILNLGGYTLSQTKECTAHYAMISNKGTLTVVNGTVSFDDTGAGDPSFGWGSYTIENRGNLVIEEGAVVEHLCDLNTVEKNIHMYCAVQQASGTTTVNGGVISTPTYRSLRVNGGTATFNGGVFEGQVWMHPFTDSTALTINGGEFAPRGGDGSSVYVENSSKAVGLTVNGGYFATKIGSSNVIENAIHGGLFGVDPSGFKAKVATDRIVVKTGDVWGVFEALTAADEEAFVAAVANGGQITLEQNITLTKTLVVEKPTVILMNGKTISANIHKNVGAVIKNISVLTLENGTISSLAENGGSALVNNGTANVNGVTLNGASNANGSWPSYTVNNTGVLVLNNSTITSYHGAVSSYNNGALVTLNNTNIEMTGITGFTSHGIYTYNNGAAVVNSGNIANNATDQNSTGASVINGAITVNGGNFTGRIESYYGTPVLKGGTFSVKPNKNYIPEGYEVVEKNGKYTIIGVVKTAEALAEALVAGGKITLGADITLTETAVIAEGATVVLDLNGKTLAHADEENKYAIDNHGTLTIKGNGTVNARGIYNGYNNGSCIATAKLTIENGTFNAKGTNGGAAIFNYGVAEINGGNFTSIGGYSLNNQEGASMTIADGVKANNGIYNSGATLTINGGEIEGNRSGCHVVYAWNATVTINGGSIHNNNSGNSTLMAAGTTKMTVKGGTFSIQDGRIPGNSNTWTSCLTDTQNSAELTVNGGTFNGGFRVQAGSTMNINGGSFNDCTGSAYSIYGTAVVKGGKYTDDAAKNFATKYLADGFELNSNGEVVAK